MESTSWVEPILLHISLIRKICLFCLKENIPHIDKYNLDLKALKSSIITHDESKLNINSISEGYKLLFEKGIDNLTEKEKSVVNKATILHMSIEKHHPEYWFYKFIYVPEQYFNVKNRNKPGPNPVEAYEMPLTFVFEMICDWYAESVGDNKSPIEWYNKNNNVRWIFSDEQNAFIQDVITYLDNTYFDVFRRIYKIVYTE